MSDPDFNKYQNPTTSIEGTHNLTALHAERVLEKSPKPLAAGWEEKGIKGFILFLENGIKGEFITIKCISMCDITVQKWGKKFFFGFIKIKCFLKKKAFKCFLCF